MTGPVLVTGGQGFVGSNVVAHLRRCRREVLDPPRRELDLGDETGVLVYLREHDVETVVHTARRTGGVAASLADPVGSFLDNTAIGSNVVRAAHAAGVPRLLHVSSSCVYPAGLELLREDDLMTGPLEPGDEGTALAEIAVGRICDWVSAGRDDRLYRTILLPDVYGPGDHPDREALPTGVLAEVAHARRTAAEELELPGDGTARRELLHVQDLCGAVEHLLGRLELVPRYLNVGAGEDHSLLELYTAAARVTGWEGRFVHDLDRRSAATRGRLDVSRLAALGWSASVGLDDGLRTTLAWHEEHVRQPAPARA